ncbi:MAG: nitric oxide reductase activation protein NorD [Nitrospiraceae bacterium]
MEQSVPDALAGRLADGLGQAEAVALAGALDRAGQAAAVLALLDELREVSAKAAQSAVEALPELQRRAGLADVVAWLDLGVALAESSGAAALKYFKDSPLVLGLLEPALRGSTLRLALELAEDDPNVALEFFRKTPELLTVLPASDLRPWAEACSELARVEYVLGIEFVRQVPAVAQVLPLELVHPWIRFGMKLVAQNSLGKTDYVGTLEFFRTSPAILSDIECRPVRAGVIDVGSVLADRSPQLAIDFLAESPALLRRLPSEEWQTRVLRYAPLVAERDADATLNYLRRCPEIVALLGPTLPSSPSASLRAGLEGEGQGGGKFEQWFKGGMEVLEFSADGGRAYFALETKKALASVEQAMSGVPLRQIARSLKLFAQGLCGIDVAIHSLPETPEPGKEPPRATVSADGRTILLPSLVRRYPTREENIRLYTVMAAHEAGHLEFGTYALAVDQLADLISDVRVRYAHEERDSVQTLGRLFKLYPQPGLIRDLWTVLEDARVEYLLRHEYPGLTADLARQAQDAIRTHTLTQGMTVREIVVDALLLLSTAEPGTFRIPDAIATVAEEAWAQCQTMFRSTGTAEDVVRLADRLYVLLDQRLAPVTMRQQAKAPPQEPEQDLGVGPRASETQTDQYRPITNWVYRGAMNPDVIGTQQGGAGEPGEMPAGTEGSGITTLHASGGTREGSRPAPTASGVGMADPHRQAGTSPDSAADQLLHVGDDRRGAHAAASPSERIFLYDEWDGLIQDYRSRWCRVVEQVSAEATADFAELTLAAHGPAVRLLRRYFESIRPPGLRRVHGQTDGEELDLDALIRRAADQAAGAEPSDRIYIRREKRERDVAVAFLVDLSGSTSRQLETGGRRVIDVEKEGMVLLCEALEAVGDQYAIYGYSGRGRAQVDFVVVKEFDEHDRSLPARRIGAVTPLHQNRDGAAIRHATAKLLARDARVKLLVLLSDGKPLDDGYADEYALEDTKRALREARMAGVDPFCITVDRGADDYLKRMYGDVNFLIIDQVASLPERLPRVYQRLTT